MLNYKLILAWLDCHRIQELIRTKQINMVALGRIRVRDVSTDTFNACSIN